MPWMGPNNRILSEAQLAKMAADEARLRKFEEEAKVEAAKKAGLLGPNGEGPPDPEPLPPPDPEDAEMATRWDGQATKRIGPVVGAYPVTTSWDVANTLEILRKILSDREADPELLLEAVKLILREP